MTETLLDTLGRRNRLHPDKPCEWCQTVFRPKDADSRFCSRPCMYSARRGKAAWNKGAGQGWIESKKGYRAIRVDGQFKREHVHIAETRILGRPLAKNEVVHHINHVRADNRIENLVVMLKTDHDELHREQPNRRSAKGTKLNLSQEERDARSQRMRQMRARQQS